jgi:crotonobetainyl-CoA:carnitine CoA-transferase CaiB-like acyl-CoA transferase
VRVLDMTWLWTGPHCTMALAFLGADVIKVESSKRPDLTRRSHIFPPDMEPGLNRCGYFNQIGQSKRSIGIDLQTPEGVELVLKLAEQSDVMVSNFGTGVMERLGLDADDVLRRNPNLTVATISAFGQSGPLRGYMGYGPLVHAVGGLSAQSGYADGIPRDIGMAYGDPNGGVYAAIAITAALWSRRRHGGGGQVVDVSMWDAMLATAFEGWTNHAFGNAPFPMMGNRDPVWAPHNLYRCAGDDEWIAIAVTDESQWKGLCRALGASAMAEDPRWRDHAGRKRNEDALDAVIQDWCTGLDKWEATRRLQAESVPAFPSLDNEELLNDPHLNARGLFTAWPHPEVGVRKLVGAPWHFANRPNGEGFAAPCLGQHTDQVLADVLGLDAAERARLREHQVIE